MARPGHLIISITAGVPLELLEEACPRIPGDPGHAQHPHPGGGRDAALAPGRGVSPEDLALALELFQAVGEAVVVEEKLMETCDWLKRQRSGLCGGVIEALADGGVKMGLPRPLALTLATQTVLGTARLCQEEQMHPAVLKDMVTSPGGTTIAGIHALESKGFRGAVMDAVTAAAARSKELGKGK